MKTKNNKIVKYILLFSFSLIFLTFTQLLFFGNRLDYFWNYNNSLQITNGLLPYQDINIITTPLFHFIVSFFLFIFGKNIIVYAIVLSILDILFIFICTKITYLLVNKKDGDISIPVFFIYTILFYSFYFEYNFLSCLFVLLIIYIELKNKKTDKRISFLIGLFAGFSLLSKQTVGLFAILFVIAKPFIFKENKKNILYRLIGISLPIVSFITYLLLSNTLDSFISYCIVGLKEFNNALSLFEIMKINNTLSYSIISVILYIVSFITLLYYCKKFFDKKFSKDKKIVFYYSIICFSVAYPIRDMHHIYPGFLSILPLIIVIFNKRITDYFKSINKNYYILLKRCAYLFIILIPIVTVNIYIGTWNKGDYDRLVALKDNYNSINGMFVKSELKSQIDEVIDYEKEMSLKGYKTIHLNREAVIYHLSLDVYYKDFDLFMRGNFGENGEQRLINEINELEKTVFIIDLYDYYTKDQKYNQIPFDIIEYVMKNFKIVGQINRYTVYSKEFI